MQQSLIVCSKETEMFKDYIEQQTFFIALSCSFNKYRRCSPLIFSSIAFAMDS